MSNASLDHSFTAFWRRHTTNHPEHRTRALRSLAYNAWRSGLRYESKGPSAADRGDALASAPPSAPDDVDRLVRELDVALNGSEGAAPQASLCDLVDQVQRIVRERGAPLLAPSAPVGVDVPQLAEQARAWELVFCTLEEVSPGWRDGKEPAMYQAAKAIRAIAQQPAAPDAVMRLPDSWRWDADNEDGLTAGYRKALRYVADQLQNALAFAQQPAACDMGALCIGCEPRSDDGSCPGQQPAAPYLRAGDWPKGHPQSVEAAKAYIRDWCPDHVKDYIDSLTQQPAAPSVEAVAESCDQWVRDGMEGVRKCANKPAHGDTLCKRHRAAADKSGYSPARTVGTAPQQPAGVDGGLTDEAIERALDAPLGLDHTLRQLVRGDTVPVGFSKVDVVRELLRALAAQQQGGAE